MSVLVVLFLIALVAGLLKAGSMAHVGAHFQGVAALTGDIPHALETGSGVEGSQVVHTHPHDPADHSHDAMGLPPASASHVAPRWLLSVTRYLLPICTDRRGRIERPPRVT